MYSKQLLTPARVSVRPYARQGSEKAFESFTSVLTLQLNSNLMGKILSFILHFTHKETQPGLPSPARFSVKTWTS